MYCNFFGFAEKPFELTPDPKFLYLTQVNHEMLASVVNGINARCGLIAIIGEVGTGKTIMLNALLDEFNNTTKIAFIFNTDVTFKQLLIMSLIEFELISPKEDLSKTLALRCLHEFAIKQAESGGNVVLIMDEAQNFNSNTLENLRLLSNIETRQHKLLQIVLSGQLNLDYKLRQPDLRQLEQRISIKHYAMPLSEEDTYQYIAHRLGVANYKGPPIFEKQTLKFIWEHSKGIPRKINTLCANALMIGYAKETKTMDRDIIEEVIRNLTFNPYEK